MKSSWQLIKWERIFLYMNWLLNFNRLPAFCQGHLKKLLLFEWIDLLIQTETENFLKKKNWFYFVKPVIYNLRILKNKSRVLRSIKILCICLYLRIFKLLLYLKLVCINSFVFKSLFVFNNTKFCLVLNQFFIFFFSFLLTIRDRQHFFANPQPLLIG